MLAVAESPVRSEYEATGTVRAQTSATISSKLMGYAREVRARVGEKVHEGQALVLLDARDLESNLRRAEAARDEVRSTIPEADSAIAAARSQFDLALVSFNRMKDLLEKRSATKQEFDEASARMRTAEAGLEITRAKRAQLTAKMAQMEQEVRAASIQRGYAEIAAPFSGTIITKWVEAGSLAVPGAPLFTIEREGAYRLEVSVEESRLPLMRLGSPASVNIDSINRTFNVRISEIVPSVDPAARAGTVKLDLPSTAGLRSGSFGRALFGAGVRNAITVAMGSVREQGQLHSVYVAENGVARLRLITLGGKFGDRVEVLTGLNPGDRVIAPVPSGLIDGAPIEAGQ